MQEVFRDIPNYKGMYQVSNLGNVKSLKRKGCLKDKFLKLCYDSRGYLNCNLHKNNVQKTRTVHQLVAISFLNHKIDGHKLVVNHINFNKSDNRLENLEVITQRKNANKKHIKSSSKYVGVYYNKANGKWISQININKTIKYLGSFKDEYKAYLAYKEELSKLC